MKSDELIALLEAALQLPVLERKIQRGAVYDLLTRNKAQAESNKTQVAIRAALAQLKTP